MHKLEILLEESALGGLRPLEVDADAPVSALIPALVEELKLPQTDLFGKKLVYMLRQAPKGRILPEDASLLSAGVNQGDKLALDSYVVDGTVGTAATANQNKKARQQTSARPDPTFYNSVTYANGFEQLPLEEASQTPPQVLLPEHDDKWTGKWTRRALLGATGAVAALAGVTVAYGAASGLLDKIFTGPNQTAMQAPTKRQPAPAQNALPTKLQSQAVLTRHQQLVRTVAWSPDGTMLASGADDQQLIVWKANGTFFGNLRHLAPVNAVAWSPDSQRFVTAAGTQLTFYNALTGVIQGRGNSHNLFVTSLAWAKNGQQQVVSGGQDRLAIVWNPQTFLPITRFALHTTPILAVSWASDGQTVASFSHVVRVWNGTTGQQVHGYFMLANNLAMQAGAFAPNGPQVAVGSDDGVVSFWNGLTCQNQQGTVNLQCVDLPQQQLQIAQQPIRAVAWSPDGRFLAIGAEDGKLSIWNMMQPAQKPMISVQQNAPVLSIAWAPNGKMIASASQNTVTIWALM